MDQEIQKVAVIHQSGYTPKWQGVIAPLRKGRYYCIDIPISGDAPKHFIRVYEYGAARKECRRKWTPYIAKVGHKWYPMESITEYLLNRIGESFGVKMASSKLMVVREQIWFLSRYFLQKDERLVHGAQIYSGLLEDEAFVEDVEQQGMSRELFTFQFTEEAIAHVFPDHQEQILGEFTKMLIFDAIIGNNDRHFYNWGVITDLKGKKNPVFSPVYDTARGLFWNLSEQKIVEFCSHPKQVTQRLNKYVEASRPKIGWDGTTNINHFKLVELLFNEDKRFRTICANMLATESLERALNLLESEFPRLMSSERRSLIKLCLESRFQQLQNLL